MRFVKSGIQLLVVIEHFVLLIILYMAAHYYNGLPHEKHKKASQQSQAQNNNPANHHNLKAAGIEAFQKADEFNNQDIIRTMCGRRRAAPDIALHKINDVAHDLWLQHVEIVGQYNEKDTDAQSHPVLPEIFVERLQMFHSKAPKLG